MMLEIDLCSTKLIAESRRAYCSIYFALFQRCLPGALALCPGVGVGSGDGVDRRRVASMRKARCRFGAALPFSPKVVAMH